MQSQSIEYLLDQYTTGRITEKEWEELSVLLQDPDQGIPIQERITALLKQAAGDRQSGSAIEQSAEFRSLSGGATLSDQPDRAAHLLSNILSIDKTAGEEDLATFPEPENVLSVVPVQGRNPLVLKSLWKWAGAAVLVLAIATGGYKYLTRPAKGLSPQTTGTLHPNPDIVPGSDKAILTLAGGKQIILTNAQNGVLSQQGNIKVIKMDSGKLSYLADNSGQEETSRAPSFNTISTPRGGQYKIILADGTKVWLNAASSLKFPTVFDGKERRVELTGEAYFEVSGDKNRPFSVQAGSSRIEVLGTHFDVKAYKDEKTIRTTLLEGSVKMDEGTGSTLLHPGEQGAFDTNTGTLTSKEVNVRAVTAWKDGYYYFDRTDIEDVMRQIARWYDVEIVYKGAIPQDQIVGKIPRKADVTDVLHIMELIGLHFNIEGKKIIVHA